MVAARTHCVRVRPGSHPVRARLFETLAGWHVRTDGAHTTKNCSAAAWRSVSRPTATLDAERVRAIRRGRREVARQAASS